MEDKIDIPQLSISRMIMLHLIPGIFTVLFYILMVPIVESWDFPNRFALLIAIATVLIPIEFGFLIYQSKKLNQKYFSFKNVIYYCKPIATWKYIIYSLVLLVYGLSISIWVAPFIDNFIYDNCFSWFPKEYILANSFENYKKSNLIIMVVFGLILNGILGPIIEELYFRGYLLPRMSKLGVSAVIISVLLHATYHFWMLWRIPSLFLALFPAALVVWYKKNIKIGILIHVVGNSLGSILTLIAILRL